MISTHLSNIKALILDMDGVLWSDTEPIGNLPVIFDQIQAFGYRYMFVTNNATKTVDEYLDKLAGFGVKIEIEQILTAAEATGGYLSEQYPVNTSVYVVGQPSLKHTLAAHGLNVVDNTRLDAKIVVASLDYHLTYEKLKHASLLIQAGCDFIGTNPDRTLPTPEGFIPGSGTVIEALEIASGKKAKIVGKPEPLLYQIALKRLGTLPHETLAVGDRLETDIAGAQAAGIHTALVLTGASSLKQAQEYMPSPEIVTTNLTELIS
ncbi:MAG: HAD-IIA family hydrolase [Chloroflexota bacterium]|nr:HAD-IIA family hydrolase [Chloroflexota bacterium]